MGENNKIIIGISGSMTYEEEGDFLGYERAYVSNDYVQYEKVVQLDR